MFKALIIATALISAPYSWSDDLPTPATTNQDPLWELGVAAGFGQLPDYPGSDQQRFRLLALPYPVYRGEVIRSDDKEGTRARILQNEDIDIDVSAAGSFPAYSKDNEARRGMPDLDWLAEIGPRLEVIFTRFGGRGRFRLLLPVRAVFSTDFTNLNHRGFTFTPGLSVDFNDFPRQDWKTFFKLQTALIDEKLARYFYEVEPHYVTTDRAAYSAGGGYLQSDFMIGLVTPMSPKWRIYSGYWISTLQGSHNQRSPLMRTTWNNTWIIGMTYLFHESEARGYE